MWLGTWRPNVTYVNTKLNGIEGQIDAPVFYIKSKNAFDGQFMGDLIGIRVQEPKGKVEFASVVMEFVDDTAERFDVSISFNSVLNSFMNSFIGGMQSGSDFKNITLSLYQSDDGYARGGVFKDEKKMDWGVDMADFVAKTRKVKINGKDQTDREELDNYFREEIVKINKYIANLNGIGDEAEDNDLANELDNVADQNSPRQESPKATSDEDMPF